MKAAVKQVRSYNQRNVSPSLKAEAWRRFLAAFSKDNPYSSEDEDLRNEAQNQIDNWETQQEQLKTKKKRLAEFKRKSETEKKNRKRLAALKIKPETSTEPRGRDGQVNVLYWQAPSTMNPYLSRGITDLVASSVVLEPRARSTTKKVICWPGSLRKFLQWKTEVFPRS